MNAPAAALVPGASTAIDDFPVDLSWSAAGDQFAVAGGEGSLHRIARDGGEAERVAALEQGLLAVAWQPKGTLVATAGQDGSVRLWEMSGEAVAGREPRVVHRGRGWPAGLAWRADGQRLAFAVGRALHVLDAGGATTILLDAHTANLSHLAWRGRDQVVAAGNGALFLDRVDRGGQVEQFLLEGTPQTLTLSPDLKIVASGLADGTVNFRHLNLNRRSRMSGYEGKVDQTTWSANSRLLATASSGAGSIVIWDFGGKGPEGSEPLQLDAHGERIAALEWQPGGAHLVSIGRDWKLALWRPGPGSKRPLDVQRLEGDPALARWSPDGRWLAVAESSGRIRCYSLRT
jgi:WD40 repeat protein